MLDDIDQSLVGQRTVVVGAGVIGTMHALFALLKGANVVHLERDAIPHGATVRNFGLIWVSGRAAGSELQLALRARELWETISHDAPGIGFRANGSLTLVDTVAQYRVVERALARDDASERGFALLSRDEVKRKNPALQGHFDVGLWCERDAAVESRAALGALREWMTSTGRYEYLANRELVSMGDGEVVDHRGAHHSGDHIWICLGATLSGFAAELFEGEPLRRVRLQMAETKPFDTTLTTSIANGDSFRYYPGFRDDATELLDPQDPALAAYAIQLLCQQRLHGGLTIGDTHEVDEPGLFETNDGPMDLIVQAARTVLGDAMPAIERRWTGVYHQLSDPRTDEIYYRRDLARGVTAITGAAGRGMTLAPAIAEESFK